MVTDGKITDWTFRGRQQRANEAIAQHQRIEQACISLAELFPDYDKVMSVNIYLGTLTIQVHPDYSQPAEEWSAEAEAKRFASQLREHFGATRMDRDIKVIANDYVVTQYTFETHGVWGLDRISVVGAGTPPTCTVEYEEQVVKVAKVTCLGGGE